MPVDYSKGKIYKILNSVNNIEYVGSTTRPYLATRMAGHRHDSKTRTHPLYKAMNEIGAEHFRIVLHSAFPCNSKDELEAEEYRVLDTVIATGIPVYNAMINGKHSDETKKKMVAACKGGHHFSCGYLAIDKGNWLFRWTENGTSRSKSFAKKKYGYWKAKAMAEALRKQQYPQWTKDPEEDALDGLMAIELD